MKSPSAELSSAVVDLAAKAVRDKIAAFREIKRIRIKDATYLDLERGWVYEACRAAYDSGLAGHNAIVRQGLQDLGYITTDLEDTGEPIIKHSGWVRV